MTISAKECWRALQNGSGLSAVFCVATDANANVRKILLSLEEPLVAIIYRAVVLSDYFELVIGIVALADALNRLVNGLPFVVAGQQNAYRRPVRIIFFDASAGPRPPQNSGHQTPEDTGGQ